ncbi:MAG: hypothetical protein R3B99_08250 [Polyangiales bacterium]
MTVYAQAASLAEEVYERLEELASYELETVKVEGEWVWRLEGDEATWVLWVSGNHLVKLGVPVGRELPEELAEAYLDLYPSDLGENGRAREGTASAGSSAAQREEDGEMDVPTSLREGAPLTALGTDETGGRVDSAMPSDAQREEGGPRDTSRWTDPPTSARRREPRIGPKRAHAARHPGPSIVCAGRLRRGLPQGAFDVDNRSSTSTSRLPRGVTTNAWRRPRRVPTRFAKSSISLRVLYR